MSSHFWVLPALLFLFSAVDIGNGSVCWDGERFSLVLFDVTMQSSLLIWGTVQSCLFRGNNAEFSVAMGNGSVLSFSM